MNNQLFSIVKNKQAPLKLPEYDPNIPLYDDISTMNFWDVKYPASISSGYNHIDSMDYSPTIRNDPGKIYANNSYIHYGCPVSMPESLHDYSSKNMYDIKTALSFPRQPYIDSSILLDSTNQYDKQMKQHMKMIKNPPTN